MQITLDLVPYDLQQIDEHTIVMESEHYAEKLRIKSRFTEKYAGFNYEDNQTCQICDGEGFVETDQGDGDCDECHGDGAKHWNTFVNLDVEGDKLTFYCHRQPITLDMIVFFFITNEYAIDEIGYECLEADPEMGW